jgi:hypothetical protein
MSKRSELLESIATTIADYRAGEIDVPTPDHVDRWIKQFDRNVQVAMLAEFAHVFEQIYVSKVMVREFLSTLVVNKKITGDDPYTFWENVRFLNIQGGGNSQKEMLEMFDRVLRKECDLDLQECGKNSRTFLYLDDAIFSGNRVRLDLSSWIKEEAPTKAELHVVVIALHAGGHYYASTALKKAARNVGKNIKVTWWRCVYIEDRKSNINTSNVLRPTSLPQDGRTQAYVEMLKNAGYPPTLRQAGIMGNETIFSS